MFVIYHGKNVCDWVQQVTIFLRNVKYPIKPVVNETFSSTTFSGDSVVCNHECEIKRVPKCRPQHCPMKSRQSCHVTFLSNKERGWKAGLYISLITYARRLYVFHLVDSWKNPERMCVNDEH